MPFSCCAQSIGPARDLRISPGDPNLLPGCDSSIDHFHLGFSFNLFSMHNRIIDSLYEKKILSDMFSKFSNQ